ncbi:MAG: 3D domain-containing protein [Mogibacterium sp.]|nr:3D domain-containing protein [Mogibacterium sp.]
MKTRNVIAIAAFMIIAFILGDGVENSPEVPEEVDEIKSISMRAVEKEAPADATKSFSRQEIETTTEQARTEEICIQEEEEIVIVPEIEIVTPEETEEPGPIMTFNSYAGHYELTAYIETGNPCADGVYPEVRHTAACNDPALWHKWIEIEGYGVFYVHDTGGMASNVIDLFVGSYDEAIQFGRREAEVYIINE